MALPLLRHFKHKWLDSEHFRCEFLRVNPLAQIGKILNEIFCSDQAAEITENTFDYIVQDTADILLQRYRLSYLKDEFHEIIASLVFYAVYNKVEDENPELTLSKIDSWCERFKYTGEIFTSAKKLYDIAMKQIRRKKVSIFVAMPYYSDEVVVHYNEIFESACTKLNDEGCSVDITTFPIMTFKGKTFDIEEDIMNKINDCDIFVADISQSNPNVMYELGIAAKSGKPVMILKKNRDKAKVPSDIILKYQVRFNECMDLKHPIYENLKEILREDFLAVFPK